jgi:hypothetical protein
MRRNCIGLLLVFAATAGCAAPESESAGFLGNYGGFPWPSLIKKNAEQKPDDSYARPEFTGAGRFARQPAAVGSITPNQAATNQAPATQTPANQAAAEQ